METTRFVSRNQIFYLKRELEGKLHKTAHTETEGCSWFL